MRAFRALLWKELREASIPGAAALVIVAVAQLYSNSRDQQFAAIGASGTFPTSLFTMVSAGVALLIGGAQLFRERRGDMAAFLVHRPLARGTIFWAKVLAGVTCYLVATGVPLAATYIWRTMPGHSAYPFVASMMLPAIADVLCGLVYYFAGLVVAKREARWYATWVLPLVAAWACSLLATSSASFSRAVVSTLPFLVVMMVAACSVFVAGGSYEPQSRVGRMALALCLGAGLVTASLLPLGALFVVIEREPVSRPHTGPYPPYTETGLAANGEIVRATWQPQPDLDGRTLVGVRALDGRPLDALADSVRNWKRIDVGIIATADIPLELDGAYPNVPRRGYRGTEDVFVPLLRYPKFGATAWYFMRRLGLIDVYANEYSAYQGHIGWMGPDGFTPGERMPVHRFLGELGPYLGDVYYEQPLLAFPNAVYRLDIDARAIRRVFTPPPGEVVVGAASSGDSTATLTHGPRARFDVIATNRRIYVQSRDGTPQLSAPRDSAAAGYGTVIASRAMLVDGRDTYFTYSPWRGTLPGNVLDTARVRIAGYRDDGSLVASAASLRDPTAPSVELIQWPQIVVGALLEPIVWRYNVSFTSKDSPAQRAVRDEQAPTIVSWVCAVIGSMAWVLLAWLAARRYAFSNRRFATWVVLAVALGPIAVVLMYCLLDLARRRTCRVCGRKRVVTRERCEHCGSPVAPPPRDGTELIEANAVLVGRWTLDVGR